MNRTDRRSVVRFVWTIGIGQEQMSFGKATACALTPSQGHDPAVGRVLEAPRHSGVWRSGRLAPLVRAELRATAPTSPVARITTMTEIRRESVAARTFAIRLLVGFAVVATLARVRLLCRIEVRGEAIKELVENCSADLRNSLMWRCARRSSCPRHRTAGTEHAHEFPPSRRYKGSSPTRRRCSRRQVARSRAPCR